MSDSSNEISSILAINGSPRAGKGATDVVVSRFLKGAESAGASTEELYPAKMKIAHCLGDLDCWFKHPGECRHKDDMPAVMERLKESDLLVFASPVYVDNMTSQMKKFFDRFVAFTEPYFEFEGGRSYHPRVGSRQPKVVAISVCGFPERVHFDPISLTFQRICQNMHADLLGEFYFPASSMIFSSPEKVAGQLEAVEKAGIEAVSTGTISKDTIEDANRDYVGDPELFGQEINEMFRTLRESHGNS